MERTEAVYLELLFRKGVRDEFRSEALAGLAKLRQARAELRVLVDAIRSHDDQQERARTRASSSIWCGC